MLLVAGGAAAAHATPDACQPYLGISSPTAPGVTPGNDMVPYRSSGLALLAPAGWRCITEHGSGGAVMVLMPAGYIVSVMPEPDSLEGPVMELVFLNGENSGRDSVADLESRYFPSRHVFIAEANRMDRELGFPIHRPSGPFRGDITLRKDDRSVRSSTPAFSSGLGTVSSRIRPGDRPIESMLFTTSSNGIDSLALLHVRMPAGARPTAAETLRRIATDPAFLASIAPH